MQLLVFVLLVQGEKSPASTVNRAERCLSIALIFILLKFPVSVQVIILEVIPNLFICSYGWDEGALEDFWCP